MKTVTGRSNSYFEYIPAFLPYHYSSHIVSIQQPPMIGTLSLLVAVLHRARHSPPSSKVTLRLPFIQIRHHYSYLPAELARARTAFRLVARPSGGETIYRAAPRAAVSTARTSSRLCSHFGFLLLCDISCLLHCAVLKVVHVLNRIPVYPVAEKYLILIKDKLLVGYGLTFSIYKSEFYLDISVKNNGKMIERSTLDKTRF